MRHRMPFPTALPATPIVIPVPPDVIPEKRALCEAKF